MGRGAGVDSLTGRRGFPAKGAVEIFLSETTAVPMRFGRLDRTDTRYYVRGTEGTWRAAKVAPPINPQHSREG